MRKTDLAERLVAARTKTERKRLLRTHPRIDGVRLAYEIKDICYTHWATEPAIARKALLAVNAVAAARPSAEISAIALWTEGIANITRGKLEDAVRYLDRATNGFRKLGKLHEAAQTGVAKLMALALLGKYAAAIRAGKRSLEVFNAERDNFGAGRVELNLANLYSRMERHRLSEEYGLSARRRFVHVGSTRWKIMAENGLAITYANLGNFAKARKFYKQALAAAHAESMAVTEAEIEASLGNLAAMTGNFAEAARHLERSRQMFLSIDVRHNSAVADLEIAASYMHLNLISEAADILNRTAPALRKLKLRPEEARARTLLGRATAKLGRSGTARRQFQIAEDLFEAMGNRNGLALTRLEQAELDLKTGRHTEAARLLRLAQASLQSNENPRHILLARWTQAALALKRRKSVEAEWLFHSLVLDAERLSVSELMIASLNALGEIALAKTDLSSAKKYFARAIAQLERTSATLITDEFRVAFSAATAKPYEHLTRLLLAEGRIREAFQITERSKAQALSTAIRDGRSRSRPGAPVGLEKRAGSLREELNWAYSRQARYADTSRTTLDRRIRHLERELASVSRQIGSLATAMASKRSAKADPSIDIDALIRACRQTKTAIVEFVQIDASFSAFVISRNGIRMIKDLTTETSVTKWLDQMMFQFASFRYGSKLPATVEGLLTRKTDAILTSLGTRLVGELGPLTEFDQVVIIPAGILNRVPFHALRTDAGYLIQQTEISYAPSAAAWYSLRQRRRRHNLRNSLIVGTADSSIPFVMKEVESVARKTNAPEVLSGSNATYRAFMDRVSEYHLIHIACHGQFRPDNPMYSSIHLSDGWVTANDICAKRLRAELVTLSACETGISKVFAGEEIMGLARGFFSAGANSLVLSLWAVNDEATRELMTNFYDHLKMDPPGRALRAAQLKMIAGGRNPYFWAPFIKIGK